MYTLKNDSGYPENNDLGLKMSFQISFTQDLINDVIAMRFMEGTSMYIEPLRLQF